MLFRIKMIRLQCMNNTNLTNRQLQILDILANQSLSRLKIENLLNKTNKISKVTLIRELNSLIDKKLIKTEGEAKNIVYKLIQNPILRVFDIDKYFTDDSVQRPKTNVFYNFEIFNNLDKIFSSSEKTEIFKNIKKLSEQEKLLDPTIFRREIERFTVEFAWKSSKIEGNTYSLLETEVLIKQAKEATGHSQYEAVMILNHKKAIDYILANKNEFKKLTLEKIINLHKIVSQGLEITPGIRKNKVAITGTNYMPLDSDIIIQNALEKIILVINKEDFALSKALITSCMIAYTQAFTDGNKRTSRILANAILIANDLFPISYRIVNEVDYIKNLLIFYEKQSIYNFKKMFLDQFNWAQENYFQI